MIIKNATREQVDKALATVAALYGDNIIYNRCDPANQRGDRWIVTLRCKSSKEPGHRLAAYSPWAKSQRRLVSACWHVHGEFMDALPASASITTSRTTKFVGDDWEDFNIGSIVYPTYASEACECGG